MRVLGKSREYIFWMVWGSGPGFCVSKTKCKYWLRIDIFESRCRSGESNDAVRGIHDLMQGTTAITDLARHRLAKGSTSIGNKQKPEKLDRMRIYHHSERCIEVS